MTVQGTDAAAGRSTAGRSSPDVPADDRGTRRRGRTARRLIVALAVVVLTIQAVCLIWLPLHGDQAFAALIGRDIAAGRHLYTEIFEAKQPGLYLLNAAVGVVSGYAQPAIQLVSVLAMAGAAALLSRLLYLRLQPGWVRTWTPLLVAVPFLFPLSVFDLGQSELLMCLPATAALLFAAGHGERPPSYRSAALAGVCLGVLAMFKAILILVPGVAVVIMLLMMGGTRRWRLLLVTVAGSLVVPFAVGLWLAARGDLVAALEPWFIYPAQFLSGADARPPERLVRALGRFVVLLAPAVLLAALRLPTIWRRRDPIDVALLSWLAVGLGIYLVQLWWSYYLVILVPAVVGLAVRQLDDLATWAASRGRRQRATLLVAGALLCVPLVVYGMLGVARTMADGGGLTAASRERIAERVAAYSTIRGEIAAAGLASGETLYVLGDPRYQLLAERSIPLTDNGWSAALTPPARWQRMAKELRERRPTMVFIDVESANAVDRRGGEVRSVLDQLYVVVRVGDTGTWYRSATSM